MTGPIFHYNDFSSIPALMSAKDESGVTVSLVIPALNEEQTIGSIITTARTRLMEEWPFLDEIIVIDGCSADKTVSVALDAGAQVHCVDEAGPDVSCRGKGTCLWKSQFVAQGDLIVFIDADIIDFDTRFICGLAGPLLLHKEISFVKAFYRRPLLLGGKCYDDFGGRVTEILVRPLLCTLVPELAQIFQPLAGECAVRRPVVETLKFSSGYGVEIGLLLDFFVKYGLSSFAQVNMESRCHRNRNASELGKTAFEVLHTMLARLEQMEVVSFNRPLLERMISPGAAGWDATMLMETELTPKCQKQPESVVR